MLFYKTSSGSLCLFFSFSHLVVFYMVVSLWRRYDWMGEEGKWERRGAEACQTQPAGTRRPGACHCTKQIGDIRSMKRYLSFVSRTVLFLDAAAIYHVHQTSYEHGIQKVWDSYKCDRSGACGFFFGGGAISNVSFIFSSKNSTLVRQRPLDPCSGVHLQWALACLYYSLKS